MKNLVRIQANAGGHAVAIAAAINLSAPDKASDPMPSEIVWMPAGTHAINASTLDGAGYAGEVRCDEQAARAVIASFQKITATGQRVWLDFGHDDGAASAWVKRFSWDATRGIIAHVEWTANGEAAIRGKSYYSFSPAFAAEAKTGRIVSLLDGHAAGGLVNAPAFGAAMPALIAARMNGATKQPAPGGSPEQLPNMKDILVKLLAALKVTPPADSTEEQLIELFAKHSENNKSAELAALKDEVAAVQAALKADADRKAKKKADKEAAEQAEIQAKAAADKAKADKEAAAKQASEFAEIKAQLAAIRAGASAAGAGPGIVEVTASVEDTLKGYAKLSGDSRARGVFYRDNIRPIIAKIGGGSFTQEIVTALPRLTRYTEIQANTLGTLTGNLIAQQAIALAKYEYPILSLISTDYSNAAAKFNQTIDTRLKSALSASQYTSAYTATAATLTDVPITLSHHPYCQVAFNANEIAGTNRDLFGEQAEVVLYAVISDMVDALYALITSSNFTTTVLKLASGTDGTTYTRADAVKAARQLFKNKMPRTPRFNLLNAEAYGALAADSAVVSLAAYQKPEIITGYELPDIAGMKTIQAVNLPFTGGMVGFAAHPRALAIATRPTNDYTQAIPGVVPGAVSQVTDPDTGITVTVTQFVDHAAGAANYRVALMYGVAKGDPLAGIITEEAAGS